MPVLFAFREDRFGFQFEVGDRAVLGRSPECELILFDRATSRQHAEILKTEDGYILKDLGSTNGTLHNEEPVDGQVPLKRNDEIKVGQEVFLFDPELDVAVGPDGAVLIVGAVDETPDGAMVCNPEPDLAALERGNLAPLFQVSSALSNRPKKNRVLKQSAYAVMKLFQGSSMVILWPETTATDRLTALMAAPTDRRIALPRPMVDQVLIENQAVIWPQALAELDFVKGERTLEVKNHYAMAVPLKAHGDLLGLLYVESDKKQYGDKDLNFFIALSGLIGAALVNASLIGQLESRLARDEEELSRSGDFLGEDHQIKALLGTAYQIAQTEVRILLTGEAGTGKEVLARQIHSHSQRRRGPFISINCSALAPGQVERALFGSEAGSLDDEGAPGLVEQADGGTVFVRHVDHLSPPGQVELLRTIEEGVVYRVGSSVPHPVNFRMIASTSMDIERMVEEGEFREDLYQRLAGVVLTMPSLREIKGDIEMLTKYFLTRAARELGLNVPELDFTVVNCFQAYPWPGNVGELKNYIDRLIMFAVGDRISIDDLSPEIRYAGDAFGSFDGEPPTEMISEVERLLIRRCLARTNGDQEITSQVLGISGDLLGERIQRYEIRLD